MLLAHIAVHDVGHMQSSHMSAGLAEWQSFTAEAKKRIKIPETPEQQYRPTVLEAVSDKFLVRVCIPGRGRF